MCFPVSQIILVVDVDECTGTVSLVCNERAWAVGLWLSLLSKRVTLLHLEGEGSLAITVAEGKRGANCASLSATTRPICYKEGAVRACCLLALIP